MPDVLDVVAAAERVDPEGALELVRLATYETLADLVEAWGLDEALSHEVAESNNRVRRELVRKFIDARLSQSEVSPLIDAALDVVAMDAVVSKAAGDYERAHNEKHGAGGRFARLNGAVDVVDRLTSSPEKSKIQGRGDQFSQASGYDRARMVGRALQSTNHPAAQATGVAMDVVGQLGPEADAVFGNHLRRAAYRYRGTEKNPDPKMTQRVDSADRLAAALTSKDPAYRKKGQDVLDQFGHGRPGREGIVERPATVEIAEYNAKQLGREDGYGSRDQVLLNTRADVATSLMLKHIPSMANVDLSMKAGKVPPSQGVIIDREGQAATQAMGFNGDHYLPFDLKNLKALHGGQYVRTRAIGGPTTEDIYTGLMSGARQMTVVSNNGVFTVEFDPDLRGGRRYNDKARQMVSRYQAILDTIAGGEVTTGQLSQDRLKELRRQALADANNDPDEAKRLFGEYKTQEQKRELFSREDEDFGEQAYQQARAEAQDALQRGSKHGEYSPQAIARRTQGLTGEMRREAAVNQLSRMQLDGPGYFRAMKALQEEFPYYIRRTDFVPLEEWQTERGLKEPGQRGPKYRGIKRSGNETHVGSGMLAFGQKERGRRGKAEAEEPKTREGAPATRATSVTPAEPAHPFGSEATLTARQLMDLREVGYRLTDASGMFYQDDNMKDVDLKDVHNAGQVAEWNRLHGNTIRTAFAKMDTHDQDRILRYCYDKPSIAASMPPDQRDNLGEAEDAMEHVGATLKLIAPFGEHLDEHSATDEHFNEFSRPLKVHELDSIGSDANALRQWRKRITSGALEQDIADFEGQGPGHAAEAIKERQVAHEQTYNTGGDTEKSMEALKRAHIAHSYHHALALAESAPKAPAPPRAGRTEPVSARDPKAESWVVLRRALVEIFDQ